MPQRRDRRSSPADHFIRRLSAALLAIVGFFARAGLASAQEPAGATSTRVVAITFDDLPYVSRESPTSPAEAIVTERKIVSVLRRARVPATGFVNEEKVQALGPIGRRLLAKWNKGHLELGNHGYSHFDSNNLEIAGIEREIVLGEATIRPLATSARRSVPFFRFPYNHVGDTEAKRVAIERLLKEHGYKLAASTIDTSDYLFNAAYEQAIAKRDKVMMERIEKAYLDHSRVQIAYYGNLGRTVLGREVPAIILLHANRLNAATIQQLLGLFRSARYRFVSLAQAQADPVYSAMPAVATKFGPMWAYRWVREREVKVDGRLEQDPPAWIGAYAQGGTP